MDLVFEWDEQKAESNERKHGIGFSEAKTVFGDPLALTVFDAGHSDDEDRFRTMGVSDQGRIVVVVFAERGTRVRLISVREATPSERRQYEQATD